MSGRTDDGSPGPTQSFGAALPIVRIFDEAKAREFYLGFLGFTFDWEHRFEAGGPVYLQVRKGDCILQLSEHFGDGTPGTKIKIRTGGLAAFQASLLAKHYRSARPGLVEHDWGERSMAINDPFGNTVIFFEET